MKNKIFVAVCIAALLSGCQQTNTTSNIEAENTTNIEAENTANTKVEKSSNEIGNYTVIIGDSENVTSSYDEGELILVNFNFKNNSNEAISPDSALMLTAYQDGVQIDQVFDSELADDNYYKSIKQGADIECKVLFKLESESPVELDITEFASFEDTGTVSKTFDLK